MGYITLALVSDTFLPMPLVQWPTPRGTPHVSSASVIMTYFMTNASLVSG